VDRNPYTCRQIDLRSLLDKPTASEQLPVDLVAGSLFGILIYGGSTQNNQPADMDSIVIWETNEDKEKGP